ncbi:PucR family transcriptional regulator [Nocardia otitidiscaviarum]|uniref:PucR family transcriptional regulator n=1 Tax=Nocardia otitidiscaviarum TaxID=1823 RepID=A0A516NLX4_9NOCA|nr:helix-turn-helix domain-containing protein [Nocardia otitidiscaviarum]MCP9624714.1 helix-turn-helix domain-containing protein [Nocardia otitidiscaviarum]QDP79889.1 PucR family transcriptional regulator [Nocardia otitidiscaviarum]
MAAVRSSIPLAELLSALTDAVAELVDAPAGTAVGIGSVAFLDTGDLTAEPPPARALPHLFLQVSVSIEDAVRWLELLADGCPAELRPRAVFIKDADTLPDVRAAARAAGVALVSVNPQARWEMVHALVNRIIRAGGTPHSAGAPGALTPDTDLFGLAQTVAESTGGLVSIEDEQSRVLAYSADSTDDADPVRRLSVLGRQGPPGYLRWLQRTHVFERLHSSGDVVEVPANGEWETRGRLAIGIRAHGRPGDRPEPLGTIWVQEAAEALPADCADVLRGAAAIAARVLWRARHAPSTDTLLIQRLFGEHGGDVDIPSVAATFGIAAEGSGAVVGFGCADRARPDDAAIRRAAVTLRLHASSFRQDCITTVIDSRPYVLFPEHHSIDSVESWTRQIILRLEEQSGSPLRAAISAPVAGLADVARARAEVDRVLDRTAALPHTEQVTTLARSRTTVLLGEILTLITNNPQLRDPRLDTVIDYDTRYSAELRDSVEQYLRCHGDVRTAARLLRIHPNTLRYRLRRAAHILHMDLDDPADRLLLELQLAADSEKRGETR